MDLYSNQKGSLKRIDPKPFKLEKDIQSLVEQNSREIFDLQFVSTEFHVDNFFLDSVFFDQENKSFVVVEYKKTKSYQALNFMIEKKWPNQLVPVTFGQTFSRKASSVTLMNGAMMFSSRLLFPMTIEQSNAIPG